jgi:hypothetical protein
MKSNQSSRRFKSVITSVSRTSGPSIVDALLTQDIASEIHIAEAYQLQQRMREQGVRHPVWRCLALNPAVDSDRVFRLAAEAYEYRALAASADELTLFVRRIAPCFSRKQWRSMGQAGVVPVRRTGPSGVSSRWCFASSDPTSSQVHRVVRQAVGREYTLYQAERHLVVSLLIEVFLTMMELPRRWPHR